MLRKVFMIYITGDVHAKFDRVDAFCRRVYSSKQDILIVLGDAGINYYGNETDHQLKEKISRIPITLFCIQGNHENRPGNIPSYRTKHFHGGTVWYEEEFPSILFAKDGEIYDFDGYRTIVIGGAYSLDKYYRINNELPWFEDEQPDDRIKTRVEEQLEKNSWQIDIVLSHTVPARYVPQEAFLRGIDQSLVDKSTEEWLGTLESRLTYQKWYAGHFHTEKKIGRLEIMFNNFDVFCSNIPRR